jgi:four helix bundle protein
MLDQEIINRNRNINRGYRKLEVWQEGIELYVLVRKKLKSIDSVPFKVKAQIEDSILSCPSNIAEGYSRRSIKENINFVNIALASLSENYTQLFALHSSEDIDRIWFDEYDKKHYSLENKLIQFNKSMISKISPDEWKNDYILREIVEKYGSIE